jgi:hypothetical protein
VGTTSPEGATNNVKISTTTNVKKQQLADGLTRFDTEKAIAAAVIAVSSGSSLASSSLELARVM